jgi:hypothetical protein
MPRSVFAHAFTALTGIVIAFQLALVAGAPWGSLTQGGRVDGPLPLGARAFALASAVLLAVFIHIVRARAAPRPRFPRAVWGVVAYCAVGIVANAITPSPAERALWLPVVSLMFVASFQVARKRGSPD